MKSCDIEIPLVATCKGFECGTCRTVFLKADHARRHVASKACRGASITERAIGCVRLPDDFDPSTARLKVPVPEPPCVVTNNGDQCVGIGSVVHGNVTIIMAGSQQESNFIQKVILENEELRNQIRTIENAPGAIFKATKGVDGPMHLRNVHLAGTRVHETTERGTVNHAKIAYSKTTAIKMIDELQRALGCVTATDSPALREWARDIGGELSVVKYKKLTYVQALDLYQKANSAFYKLPDADRRAIVGGVEGVLAFMRRTV